MPSNTKPSHKCPHGRDPYWCVQCVYHDGPDRDTEEKPIDCVEKMNRNRANEFQYLRRERTDE